MTDSVILEWKTNTKLQLCSRQLKLLYNFVYRFQLLLWWCTGWVKKSRPLTTFDHIFAQVESFCIKFCTFIGSLYPHMSTDFHLFILTFNEMALILLRAPIIFTVSSFDCSAISLFCKNAEYQLNENDVIVFAIKCFMFCQQMVVWFFAPITVLRTV